ncbi:MAG: O-antigen ligase family protein, partial [Chloroflexota bacterium]
SNEGVQPNQLAGTIIWVFPLLIMIGLSCWQAGQRRLGALCLVLSGGLILILLLSQSRGGWLGGLAAISLLIWLGSFTADQVSWYRYLRLGMPAAGILAILLLIIVLEPQTILNLWLDPPDRSLVGNLGTLSFRQEVWLWAVAALQDFPITGTGLGTFRVVVYRLYPIPFPVTYDLAHAHNVFLQVGLDFGLPGLILYLSILGTYFYLGARLLFVPFSNRLIVMGLLSAMFGFHIYGLVDTIAIGAKPGLLFWLLLALMDGAWRLNYSDLR